MHEVVTDLKILFYTLLVDDLFWRCGPPPPLHRFSYELGRPQNKTGFVSTERISSTTIKDLPKSEHDVTTAHRDYAEPNTCFGLEYHHDVEKYVLRYV